MGRQQLLLELVRSIHATDRVLPKSFLQMQFYARNIRGKDTAKNHAGWRELRTKLPKIEELNKAHVAKFEESIFYSVLSLYRRSYFVEQNLVRTITLLHDLSDKIADLLTGKESLFRATVDPHLNKYLVGYFSEKGIAIKSAPLDLISAFYAISESLYSSLEEIDPNREKVRPTKGRRSESRRTIFIANIASSFRLVNLKASSYPKSFFGRFVSCILKELGEDNLNSDNLKNALLAGIKYEKLNQRLIRKQLNEMSGNN